MTRASIEISARLVAQVAPSSRQLPPPRRRLCHSLGILLVPGAHRLAQLQPAGVAAVNGNEIFFDYLQF